MPSPAAQVRQATADAVTALTGAVARVRSDRALHPRGTVHRGSLRRLGAQPRWGLPLVDGVGEQEVLVRLSRSAGLPHPLPDVYGLALRAVRDDGELQDLLLSSAFQAPYVRTLLRPRLRQEGATYSTLVPGGTGRGPALLGALPESRSAWTLAVAHWGGPWHAFARLEVDPTPVDVPISFDPVVHAVDGLRPPAWLALLRARSYRVSRRVRHASAASLRARPPSA